jgi:hypothetical protein
MNHMYYTPSNGSEKPKFRIPREDMIHIQDQIEAIAGWHFPLLEDRDILLKKIKSRDFMWHMLAHCPWLYNDDEVRDREESITQYQRFVELSDLVNEWELYQADRKLWRARIKKSVEQ